MPKLSMLPTILAAAFAFAAGPAQAEMKSQWVEYSHGDTKLNAYMAYDDKVSGKRPLLLVMPNWLAPPCWWSMRARA